MVYFWDIETKFKLTAGKYQKYISCLPLALKCILDWCYCGSRRKGTNSVEYDNSKSIRPHAS